MIVSRLSFYTLPGRAEEVEQELKALRKCVLKLGAPNARVLRTHFASLGAPDLVFEEEAPDLASLEILMKKVIEGPDFNNWTKKISDFLAQSPKREVYEMVAET